MPAPRTYPTQALVATGPAPEHPLDIQSESEALALVIVWSAREPHRIGESACCSRGSGHVLGRAPTVEQGENALCFSAQRPPPLVDSGPQLASPELLGEALSRRQLEIRSDGAALVCTNVGRCPMWVNGKLTGRARLAHGDLVHLQQQLLLLCVQRPISWTPLRSYPVERAGRFGFADRDGIVGESAASWQLREKLAYCAQKSGHVLVLGASGAGKELITQALHQLSPRQSKPLVTENVSTLPASLGAAILFGNRRNFPNPGMEERAGLVGSAEGGTLFLDEVGDLSPELQPMLLRVMDPGGEYMRLGEESQPRRSSVRFIGATNHPERLRIELRRRFHGELVVPPLTQRLEDIPLLLRHLLTLTAHQSMHAARFLRKDQVAADPRFIEQLLRHPYTTHVAELGFLLQRAMEDSPDDILMPLSSERAAKDRFRAKKAAAPLDAPQRAELAVEDDASPDGAERRLPTAEEAQAALDATAGSVVAAAAMLSITRHQLNRMIRRERLSVTRNGKPVVSPQSSNSGPVA